MLPGMFGWLENHVPIVSSSDSMFSSCSFSMRQATSVFVLLPMPRCIPVSIGTPTAEIPDAPFHVPTPGSSTAAVAPLIFTSLHTLSRMNW